MGTAKVMCHKNGLVAACFANAGSAATLAAVFGGKKMNTWASKFLRAVSLFALLTAGFGATGPALAQTCVGNCGTDGADGVVTLPPSGDTSYQWISTAGGVTGAGELPGISGGTDGSSFQTATFAATAGQALTFNFNFVTSDGTSTYPDYAWAQLQTSTGLVVATLFTAETTPTGNTSPGQGLPPNQATLTPSATAIIPGGPTWSPLGSSSCACFGGPGNGCGYTGWIQSSYSILGAGNYQVVFGVSNETDTLYDTGLAFDQVAVGGVVVSGVPEPGTYALMLAGLSLIGIVARRRKNQRS
jgi:hypothetical protein